MGEAVDALEVKLAWSEAARTASAESRRAGLGSSEFGNQLRRRVPDGVAGMANRAHQLHVAGQIPRAKEAWHRAADTASSMGHHSDADLMHAHAKAMF